MAFWIASFPDGTRVDCNGGAPQRKREFAHIEDNDFIANRLAQLSTAAPGELLYGRRHDTKAMHKDHVGRKSEPCISALVKVG